MSPEETNATAAHEGGHFVAALHFGIPAFPELTPSDGSSPNSAPGAAGVCHLDGPVDNWQGCVIGWSGILAQAMFSERYPWMPPFTPTARDLSVWHNMMSNRLALLSESDQKMIRGYRDSWRACKSAFRILRQRGAAAMVKRVAGHQVAALAAKQGTAGCPLPEMFPATLADFERLVIGPDKPGALKDFINYKAHGHLAGGDAGRFEAARESVTRHFEKSVSAAQRAAQPGASDAEIAGLLFDAELQRAVALWQNQFAAGFGSKESWTASAYEFRSWAAGRGEQKPLPA